MKRRVRWVWPLANCGVWGWCRFSLGVAQGYVVYSRWPNWGCGAVCSRAEAQATVGYGGCGEGGPSRNARGTCLVSVMTCSGAFPG